jgi:hypothetical protein
MFIYSILAFMWSKTESLRFSVMMGLLQSLKLIRGARRAFNEDEQKKIAGQIVGHLEKSNWKIEQGPEPQGHSGIMGSNE